MRAWSRRRDADAAVRSTSTTAVAFRAAMRTRSRVMSASIGIGVLHRVVQQVDEDLFEGRRIGTHERARTRAARRRNATGGPDSPCANASTVSRARAPEVHALELVLPWLLHARELEHPLDERRQPRRLAVDDARGTARSCSGDRTRCICSVSVAALSADSGVLSWCETWATKSRCIPASSSERRWACHVKPSATSISAMVTTVGQ